MDFLQQIEATLTSSSARDAFEVSPHYATFVGKWNLAVYFQIRFHEIATPVEDACQDFFATSDSSMGCHLNATEVVLEAARKCWDPDIYIQILMPKFWKLTLQIVAR